MHSLDCVYWFLTNILCNEECLHNFSSLCFFLHIRQARLSSHFFFPVQLIIQGCATIAFCLMLLHGDFCWPILILYDYIFRDQKPLAILEQNPFHSCWCSLDSQASVDFQRYESNNQHRLRKFSIWCYQLLNSLKTCQCTKHPCILLTFLGDWQISSAI